MFEAEFKTQNAAFSDGNAEAETARILRSIADRVSQGDDMGAIRDANGNHVGSWYFDRPETDEEEG